MSKFRNENNHLWPMFLLPIVMLIKEHSKKSDDNGTLMCDIFLYSIPILLCYRFQQNYMVQFLGTLFVTLFINFLHPLDPSHSFLCILSNIYFWLIQTIPPIYTSCFTFGELAIITQSTIYYLSRIIQFNCSLFFGTIERNNYFKDENSLIILLCYSTLMVIFVLSRVATNSQIYQTFLFLLALPFCLYCLLLFSLPHEPVKWFIFYILNNEKRVYLFTIWLVILVITCAFAYIYVYLSNGAATTVTRKIFHLSISFVYLLGIKYDISFLLFASQLILFVFIYIEMLRLNQVYLVASTIDPIFNHFRDEKDVGILTLAHFYLLIGCSFPLFLSDNVNVESKLLLSSGVLTVGIGDSFASIGGYYLGRHKWPNSKKSIEGTVCFLLSQLFTLILLHLNFGFNVTYISNEKMLLYFLISLVSSLVETFTVHVDNLILPLVQYALILICFN